MFGMYSTAEYKQRALQHSYTHHVSHHHCDTLSPAVLRLTNALSFCKVPTGFVIITSFSCAEKPEKGIWWRVGALRFNMMETNGFKVCPLLHLTPYHLGFCNTLNPKTLLFVKQGFVLQRLLYLQSTKFDKRTKKQTICYSFLTPCHDV